MITIIIIIVIYYNYYYMQWLLWWLLGESYVRAKNVAEFFEVCRRKVRIGSITAVDVLINAMNIQRQRVQKLRLHQQQ